MSASESGFEHVLKLLQDKLSPSDPNAYTYYFYSLARSEVSIDFLLEEIAHHAEAIKCQLTNANKINNTSSSTAMMFCAGANRSICHANGFVVLVNSGNDLCAAELIRLQMDTAMRLACRWFARDGDDLAHNTMFGKQHFTKQQDFRGEDLRDGKIAEHVSRDFPWFKGEYNEECKLIHFTDEHLYQAIDFSEAGKLTLCLGNKAVDPEQMKAVCKRFITSIGVTRFYIAKWVREVLNEAIVDGS